MRPSDKRIFLEAAAHFQVWILVRRTNPASLRYVGQAGYTPKRIDCKAKTADADNPPYTLAGLVVDPRIHPRAFKPGKEAKALAAWKSMEPLIGRTYMVDEDKNSKHYGCLRLDGNYIHGDYDLYDIIDISQPHRNLAAVETLHGQPHRRGAKLLAVQKYVNERMGAPMVQHGGEAQYADHSEQAIDAFGPNGEDVTILNKFSLRAWYSQRFGGRQALGH
ncbi:MAG: hypothetical protein IT165_00235 [Bryobacterales bacterium]|nr:hypothetical protein [Bryobacterales bacterium]